MKVISSSKITVLEWRCGPPKKDRDFNVKDYMPFLHDRSSLRALVLQNQEGSTVGFFKDLMSGVFLVAVY